MTPRVVLVGPMGAGKTTVGRRVADALGMQFHDLDHEVETRSGAEVGLIFELEGEAGLRKRECEMLDELSAVPGTVLSTGGGETAWAGARPMKRYVSMATMGREGMAAMTRATPPCGKTGAQQPHAACSSSCNRKP